MSLKPIHKSLEYSALGKKLLLVDELPQGALPAYNRDVAAVSGVIQRKSDTLKIFDLETTYRFLDV